MFGKIKSMLKDTTAASPLLGIVVLLIAVICVIAIGSVVLTEINTSTADVTSAFYIPDLGSQWVTIVGLVFVAVLALVGFFIIRMFGQGGAE
jgi:small-conductance mechanosensitive channel